MNRCRGCDGAIIWAETTNGKRIPLDPHVSIYRVVLAESGREPGVVELVNSRSYLANHISVCPAAGAPLPASKERPERMRADIDS